jgi:hypothetical protein
VEAGCVFIVVGKGASDTLALYSIVEKCFCFKQRKGGVHRVCGI